MGLGLFLDNTREKELPPLPRYYFRDSYTDMSRPTTGEATVRESGDQAFNGVYCPKSVGDATITNNRSKLRTIILVLSCSGAMIINVSRSRLFAGG